MHSSAPPAQESTGIVPTVITSVDPTKGATLLLQAQCTVVKLHGDYLDIRNQEH